VKIGIIVYSSTGNTLYIAENLKKKLTAAGHIAVLERISQENDQEMILSRMVLKNNPELKGYDLLVFASPVNGFTLAPVYKVYLNHMPALSGTPCLCFVTQGLPWNWMGGNRALKIMKEQITAKGGKCLDNGIIHWNKKNRETLIEELIKRFIAVL
jgi:flavodoxin